MGFCSFETGKVVETKKKEIGKKMNTVTVQDLLEAGVHFGHQKRKWNPKMKNFVYGEKNGIYIIDLAKTMQQLNDACNFLQKVVSQGGKILFVGTKRQAQEVIKEAAEKTGMYYVTERWLGGTLTNNATIQKSIKKMMELDEIIATPEKASAMKKKELINLTRTCQKLHKNLDGIAKMRKLPEVLFVVDVCNEDIAIREAAKLNIPIVAIVDTNGSTDNISYPIVANDDALRSIKIITDVIAEAVKDASDIYNIKAAEERSKKEEEDKRQEDQNKENGEKKSRKIPAKKRIRKTEEERREKRKKVTSSNNEEKNEVKAEKADSNTVKKVKPKKEVIKNSKTEKTEEKNENKSE